MEEQPVLIAYSSRPKELMPQFSKPVQDIMRSNISPSMESAIQVPKSDDCSSLPFPWATPAVDTLICDLDSLDFCTREMVRRIKQQFPTLVKYAIPADVIERRIRILDQTVELDYFKRGLELGGASPENEKAASVAVAQGNAVHKDNETIQQNATLTMTKLKVLEFPVPSSHPLSKSSMEVLRRRPSGRGVRLGQAIHKTRSSPWEVMGKMQDLGREKSIKSSMSLETVRLDDLVPRPLSPARGDDHGRPPAVDKSIEKMHSFDLDRSPSPNISSLSGQSRTKSKQAVSNLVSPFPRVIRIYPTESSIRPPTDHILSESPGKANKLLNQKSSASLQGRHDPVKKMKSHRELQHPVIHVTQPSQERNVPWEDSSSTASKIAKPRFGDDKLTSAAAQDQKLQPVTLL